jgi:hypothetical protein
LKEACKTPENTKRAFDRLKEVKFSLNPAEKIESNRGPAKTIIGQLEKLLH